MRACVRMHACVQPRPAWVILPGTLALGEAAGPLPCIPCTCQFKNIDENGLKYIISKTHTFGQPKAPVVHPDVLELVGGVGWVPAFT